MTNRLVPSQIIVGVDGSEQSVDALGVTQHLAAAMNAGLLAMGCWEHAHIRIAQGTLEATGEKDDAHAEL
ncbi:hypothetical protein NHF46_07920 [Arthrobacter alpinus]|uniref:UspA domain-containing protein n=1 Tax=Arthrobacter alpinus TaxID=656366 RepID=A0A0S2M0F6_9MICC|nr:hypothetical protein [Arthrobacter alpinus]ALO67306.1 hypothetical protein AS189_13345 [Arthrobacter alpinus]MDD0857684.1 hypothetical protein [Arthrobacter alpinus]